MKNNGLCFLLLAIPLIFLIWPLLVCRTRQVVVLIPPWIGDCRRMTK